MSFTQFFSRDNFDPYTQADAPNDNDHLWKAPVASEPIQTVMSLPGSKSLTARELLLAALADRPSMLHSPLISDDTQAMIEALASLGTTIELQKTDHPFGDDLLIIPAEELIGSTTIQCNQAGTVMRFVPPLACLSLGPTVFDVHHSAKKRPILPLLEALKQLGADINVLPNGVFPFTIHGTGELRGGFASINASLSSQFISALLLAAPRFTQGLHLKHTGKRLPSLPHIDMTINCLKHRGVEVQRPSKNEWIISPTPLRSLDVTIEPDLSNAAPFLAAAVATQGTLTITGWPETTTQVGARLSDLLSAFGASIIYEKGTLTVTGPETIQGVNLDLSTAGELAPTLVALASLAQEPSHITGISHIRHHETDRLSALCEQINALGGNLTEEEDGVHIQPGTLHGGVWKTYHDHRMATAGALIGLVTEGIAIENIKTTAKTLPQFRDLWEQMLQKEYS